ncbi:MULTISPECIES: paraquat-inducible protein A [Arcobacter]|jgi:paraquat-inducible protein A|uniref:Paraquat-inducible protein A n=1 Tax=Arcobacter ellisii TaxID=913109 RepID=A0A347U9Q8_9BACT|nr:MULTISPECIES: paraquat-inducible protein A [Arcobacter]AXX95586.1 paraquat-inducible protein A [Arcobacter ellisii]MDD3009556.1 paraquat-inducible protein A [Arcobacter sp.]RXI31537.1 paraquat-inducible protein A [Arcobacter ellisii]
MVLISCKNCHKVYEKENYEDFICTRCKHKVTRRIKNSLQVSLALVICAILLYIPAMVYPIMEVTKLGVQIESTILEGVISFLNMESYFIAIVIFTASVAIPMIKLVGLLFIFISLKINIKMENKTKNLIFKFIEAIGKWSMIDIYVVAILASIVQLDEIFNIKGGIAATSFALMVILTMIAANRFDTRIIWDE